MLRGPFINVPAFIINLLMAGIEAWSAMYQLVLNRRCRRRVEVCIWDIKIEIDGCPWKMAHDLM